ncbi:MAG: hypothetical protein ACQEQO_07430 [Thermodesulfobacteriota bacterium]
MIDFFEVTGNLRPKGPMLREGTEEKPIVFKEIGVMQSSLPG